MVSYTVRGQGHCRGPAAALLDIYPPLRGSSAFVVVALARQVG
ncbi:tRNA (guanine-N7)-methyltransferase [Acetobacter orientalis]|uniref:tRNA (Guanine-N7)-methyltransferase n=1 Tax=Acetobacter orientalis TaxID=146474 RepID=A0A2Z5ZGR1_9PROT|nr:tRNA (guanine-N7)-methyltransferase [Acetobacter orientalis]